MHYAYLDRPTIMVVDSIPTNLNILNQILKKSYRVKMASCGNKALELAITAPPDLILLDTALPDIDSLEICRRLKAHPTTVKIPIILMVPEPLSLEYEQQGFAVGAVDYLHKPLSFPTTLARVKTHLQIKNWQDFLQDQSAWMQQEVQRRVQQVLQLQTATIQVIIDLAEFRDEETSNHIRRTQEYVRCLGHWLVQNNRYETELDTMAVEQMAQAASLHDIGKIAIPEHILLKPDRLTTDELKIMQTHTTRGHTILEKIRRDVDADNPLLLYSSQITRHHHEHWDGNGYPDGLQGEAIPLAARLMAVADVYDSSRSARPYKQALPHKESVDSLVQQQGKQFDPKCIEAFLNLESKIQIIADQFVDGT